MTVICGTDFSPNATLACDTAAQWASRTSGELVIVHAAQESGAKAEELRRLLDDLANNLIERFRIQVATKVVDAAPHVALMNEAKQRSAAVMFAGATGGRKGLEHFLGSTAERLATDAECPLLLVRNDAIATWLNAAVPLRVVIATDLTEASEGALQWGGKLSALGRCDYVLSHVVWPPEEMSALGVSGPMDLDQLDPRVARSIEERLHASAVRYGIDDAAVRVESSFGRTGDAIADLAEETRADLLVVGRTGFEGLARAIAGSVSARTAHLSRSNLACVAPAAVG